MTDGRRSCLGFVFLILAMVLAGLALMGGWLGWDFKTGALLSIGTFVVFAGASAFMFVTIKDYAWLPAVFGGLYAILPDLIAGPVDDVGVLALGAMLSGLFSWRRSRQAKKPIIPSQSDQ